MSEPKTCGECKWIVMGHIWGSCVCPLPVWITGLINQGDFIQPFDTKAEHCGCFEPREAKGGGKG